MQHFATTFNDDYPRYLRALRGKKIDDADFALANNDLIEAASMFEAAATLSHVLGECMLEQDLEAYSAIAKERAGVDKDDEFNPSLAKRQALSWKTYLKSLQKGASEAFSRKNYIEARYHVSRMVAIAEKIGYEELAANYRHNLVKIDEAIKTYARMISR
jgi:hypothetical protein